MCMFSAAAPAAPTLPPETAAMQYPDAGAVRTQASRRAQDQVRSANPTILTSGTGVSTFAPTEKKTLLGQ